MAFAVPIVLETSKLVKSTAPGTVQAVAPADVSHASTQVWHTYPVLAVNLVVPVLTALLYGSHVVAANLNANDKQVAAA